MRSRRIGIVLTAVLVAIGAAGTAVPLLAATAPEKAEKVASRMLKSKQAIDAATAQIDATLKSMHASLRAAALGSGSSPAAPSERLPTALGPAQ